jgi:hypothetical protein
LDNNKSYRNRSTTVKAIGLTFLSGISVMLALKFSTTESIPVFNQNNPADAATANYEVEIWASPDYRAEVFPAADIEQKPQSIPTFSSVPEIDVHKNEVRTGDKQPLLSLKEINEKYKEYGKMTIAGMKPEDYDKAMSIEWKVLNTPGEPLNLTIDLKNLMDYEMIENYIFNLDKYKGVEVSIIGKSEQDRNIYMLEIGLGEQDPSEKKPIIMITGNAHAREFAGAEYIVKFLNDTIKRANDDPYTKLLLENAVIVAVPLVNPDGREMLIDSKKSGRKSNANGVDLNRAMPSVNAGQLAKGVRRVKDFSTKPGLAFFAGYNLGTESETQAMIKWFNYYVPFADLYIDLHQQGGFVLYNKVYTSEEGDRLSKEYAVRNNILLKKGYPLRTEKGNYGLAGNGGTLTDYAKSVAEGFIYSYSLGRMVLDADGTELPLICFKDIDLYKQYYKPLNSNFKYITIEIGRYPVNRGPGKTARKYRAKEYNRFGWENFLAGTIENMLGEEQTNELRRQAGN